MKPIELNVKGYKVIFIKHPSHIVNARVVVNAGSSAEEADSHGTAHFLEHMFFKGTTKRGYKELNKLAATLGDINAYTSFNKTVYTLSFLRENVEQAVEMLFEMIFSPAFLEDEFNKEKGVITEECQTGLDDPGSFAYYQAIEHLIGGKHGHPIIGTLESINQTTVDKIKKFTSTHYDPQSMAIVIAGNLNSEKVVKIVEKYIPDKFYVDVLHEPNINVDLNFEDYSFHHKSKQAVLQLIYKGLSAQESQKRNFVSSIFHDAFGQGMQSMLFDRIREELGMCYSIYSYEDSWKNFGFCSINCLLDKKNIDTVYQEVQKLIEQVKKDGISQELFDIAKKQMMYKIASRTETSGGMSTRYDSYFMKDILSFTEIKNKVNKLKNEDVINYANYVFDGQEKVVAMTEG